MDIYTDNTAVWCIKPGLLWWDGLEPATYSIRIVVFLVKLIVAYRGMEKSMTFPALTLCLGLCLFASLIEQGHKLYVTT